MIWWHFTLQTRVDPVFHYRCMLLTMCIFTWSLWICFQQLWLMKGVASLYTPPKKSFRSPGIWLKLMSCRAFRKSIVVFLIFWFWSWNLATLLPVTWATIILQIPAKSGNMYYVTGPINTPLTIPHFWEKMQVRKTCSENKSIVSKFNSGAHSWYLGYRLSTEWSWRIMMLMGIYYWEMITS